VDSSGNVIDGVTVNQDEGTVTDAKGNVIEVDLSALKSTSNSQLPADNPDIASPPEEEQDDKKSDSTWSGAEVSDQAKEQSGDVTIAGAGGN